MLQYGDFRGVYQLYFQLLCSQEYRNLSLTLQHPVWFERLPEIYMFT
jgi:hypothetical protein